MIGLLLREVLDRLCVRLNMYLVTSHITGGIYYIITSFMLHSHSHSHKYCMSPGIRVRVIHHIVSSQFAPHPQLRGAIQLNSSTKRKLVIKRDVKIVSFEFG